MFFLKIIIFINTIAYLKISMSEIFFFCLKYLNILLLKRNCKFSISECFRLDVRRKIYRWNHICNSNLSRISYWSILINSKSKTIDALLKKLSFHIDVVSINDLISLEFKAYLLYWIQGILILNFLQIYFIISDSLLVASSPDFNCKSSVLL